MKTKFLTILFLGILQFGYSQMTKENVEYELAKYTKNTCYRFSIATLNSLKDLVEMVDGKFEIKFSENILTIINNDKYYAIPYSSISFIESSIEANKKEGKFTVYMR